MSLKNFFVFFYEGEGPYMHYVNHVRMYVLLVTVMSLSTIYDFHDSTNIFVSPSFLPFCTKKAP